MTSLEGKCARKISRPDAVSAQCCIATDTHQPKVNKGQVLPVRQVRTQVSSPPESCRSCCTRRTLANHVRRSNSDWAPEARERTAPVRATPKQSRRHGLHPSGAVGSLTSANSAPPLAQVADGSARRAARRAARTRAGMQEPWRRRGSWPPPPRILCRLRSFGPSARLRACA